MEMKPIKVLVYRDLLELIKKYDGWGLIDQAVNNVIDKPYQSVMGIAGSCWEVDYSETEPVEVYVDKRLALAWEITPKEIKDRLLSAIDDDLRFLIYGWVYINQLEGGKNHDYTINPYQ